MDGIRVLMAKNYIDNLILRLAGLKLIECVAR